jgi:hypothetical protein
MGSNSQRGSRDGDREFRTRHPGLAGITYVEEDSSLRGRVRKHLRNPPMRTVFLIVFILVAIPVAIAYPSVSGVAKENWGDVQQSRERHFVKVTAASWIYPFLRRQAERMQLADVPGEWRSVSFKNGPCFPEHMTQLPTGKYAYAVETACKNLDKIQMTYAADCAQTSACNIPEQAVVDLQIVLDRLKVAFSDANLVDLATDDQGQVRD